jgi:hypothetical protein
MKQNDPPTRYPVANRRWRVCAGEYIPVLEERLKEMELQKYGKLRKVQDEPRISPDGEPYRAMKWQHESGDTVEINVDADPVRYHARHNGGRAHVNLDEGGLIAFIVGLFRGW